MPRELKRPKRSLRDEIVAAVSIDAAAAGQNHGFDYAAAATELERHGLSLPDIGRACGVSKDAVAKWKKGATPAHDVGEALYLLYFNTFNTPEHRAAWDKHQCSAPPIRKPPNKPYAHE